MLIIVVPDIILDQIVFSFGYPAGGDKTLPENIKYISGKDIAAYNINWAYNPDLIANEYTYYEVESYWELNLGDRVTFHNYEMYVGAVTIKKENITVDPTFGERMIEKSSEMEGKLQKQIDDFNGDNNP